MLITRGDGYVTTAQLAAFLGVDPHLIRQWKRRGHIKPRGLDEHGHLLWDPDDGARADKQVRDNGLRTSGIDPRALRQRKAAA